MPTVSLCNILVDLPVVGRSYLVHFFEGLVKMREAVEAAILADLFNGYIGNDQLFGSKAHA
jgi:hypothetical protein